MRNYNYYILSKQDFTALYRFGKIPLKVEFLIKKEDDTVTEDNIIKKFFQLPFFQSDEEYLLLLVDDGKLENGFIRMSSLLEIYPLTKAAKSSYEMKFHKDLIFKDIPFTGLFVKLNLYFEKEERILAVEILPEILLTGIAGEKINLNNEIESFIDLKEKGKKSFDFQTDYLTHLLMYDRYNPFPNTDLGYFYDAGEAFAHSNGLPTFKGSKIHAYLEEQKEKLRNEKLSAIISVIEEEKEVTSAFKQITTINGIKQYLSAVLFFKFKNEINEYGKLSKSNIPKICAALIDRKIHVSELGLAVSLLGAYFGYQAFYDDYYSMSSLPVFKVKQLPIKEQSTELSPSKLNDKPEEETFNVNDTQEKAGDIYNEPLLIQEIRTLSNKHGSYLKKEMNSEVKKAIQRIDKVVVKNISDTKKYLLTNYGDHVSFGSKELIKIKSVIPGLS
jgi:hypothetical protein